jgi:PEP-CTERM motif
MRRSRIALGALVLAATPCRADVLFSDSTFNLANYTQQLYRSDPTVSVAAAQTLSNGNPAPSLEIRIAVPATTFFETQQGFIGNAFTFDPAVQGAIQSIDFSLDKNFTANQPFDFNSVRALIEQGGKFYEAIIPISTTPGVWTTGSATGLLATDFSAFDFVTGMLDANQHPSFNGSPLAFGFANRFGQTSDVPTEASEDVLYDNLALNVNVGETVPEPGSVALLGSGLAILLARRRKFT